MEYCSYKVVNREGVKIMYKLYEIIIGKMEKVIDQEAKPEETNVDGSLQHAAIAEASHIEDRGRVDVRNVVARDVPEALTKAQPFLSEEGMYVLSANFLNNVHA